MRNKKDDQEPQVYGVESRNAEFLIVKDHNGTESVGCCAATLTDTDLGLFKEWIGKPGPWYDADFFRYVAQFDWYALTGLGWMDGGKFSGLETLTYKKSRELRGNYAYVVVKSRRTDKPTSVLWDGYEVLDPDPEAENLGRELRSYTVLQLYFLDRWVGPMIGEKPRR